ncbi:hypothetical protein, partial [Burkholderia sp. lyk4-R2A-23]|uniref:hypothetical protein n=1 Tax=Burkholderia sp. lyk4-R2A-23 TaxID=3040284 RepID=UPI00254D9B76
PYPGTRESSCVIPFSLRVELNFLNLESNVEKSSLTAKINLLLRAIALAASDLVLNARPSAQVRHLTPPTEETSRNQS